MNHFISTIFVWLWIVVTYFELSKRERERDVRVCSHILIIPDIHGTPWKNIVKKRKFAVEGSMIILKNSLDIKA